MRDKSLAQHLFDELNKCGVGGLVSWNAEGAVLAQLGTVSRQVGKSYSRDWNLVDHWIRSECRILVPDHVCIYRPSFYTSSTCFVMDYAAQKGLPGVIQWTNNFSFHIGETGGWGLSWNQMEQAMFLAIDSLSHTWRNPSHSGSA